MGVSLYRQEKMWDDIGLVLPRNMMANWCMKISEYYLKKMVNLISEQIKAEKANDKKEIDKYMPWSKDLPIEIVNFQGEYEELDLNKE